MLFLINAELPFDLSKLIPFLPLLTQRLFSNKNIPLYTPTTEKLTAVKNSSGNGFWVLSHKFNSNEFIAYEITSLGVNPTPVISAVGTIISDSQAAIGQIKIAPNGSKVAVARRGNLNEVQLFDFKIV